MTAKVVTFDATERKRLGNACKILGITFAEFVHDAAMQAVDEFEGEARATIKRAVK
ncbi:MAG: hypothetical protein ACYCPT_13740 [Acidimicrobiales bacterium]